MSSAKRPNQPGDAATDRTPVWPALLFWVPLMALTVAILGPVKTLAWQLLVVPGHVLHLLARRTLPDWAGVAALVLAWLTTGVVLWIWGPGDARYGGPAAFYTACLLWIIEDRRKGISPGLEKLARERLIEGLILLSLPAEEQIRSVHSIPRATDVSEALLAQVLGPFYLIRDHSAKPVGELFALLRDLEALINAQPEDFRTDESLRTSPEWEQLRTLARTALDKVGVDRRVPDLDFLREDVEGKPGS